MDVRLASYIEQQVKICPTLMRNKTMQNGRMLLSRNIFVKVRKYVVDFIEKDNDRRWVIIPGLRGTGKTTILAQSYLYLAQSYADKVDIIYFSLDDVMMAGFNLYDLVSAYLSLRSPDSQNSRSRKTIIILDELQNDPRWAAILKTFYDKYSNLFFICSGSSAVYLQTSADVAGRRANIERLYPMSFTEFEVIKTNKYPIKDLKNNLSSALYDSQSAEECCNRLLENNNLVNDYLSQIDINDWNYYVRCGSLPFTLSMQEPSEIYSQIMLTIEKVIQNDLRQIISFDDNTAIAARKLIGLLADAEDSISVVKTASILGLNKNTLSAILDALCKAEMLIDVVPLGSNFTAAKKEHKYLFSSPVIRAAFYYLNGSPSSENVRTGRLLEDVVGLQLYKMNGIYNKGSIFYDCAQGGVDFILKRGEQAIAIEVGKGRKTGRQVASTIKRHPCCKYGITICDTDEIVMDETKQSVMIPWRIFALSG